jgi:fumarylacetoacetase
MIDATHNPELKSWVASANDPSTDFPIQNLPFGRFKLDYDSDWRIGVAIGDFVLDLCGCGLIQSSDMNRFIRLAKEPRLAVRRALSEGLAEGSAKQKSWSSHLFSQKEVSMGLPCEIRDYTDFYIGIHHATTVGKLFRPDNPLLPNYKWVPIGYHGRASSIQVSGHDFKRPQGQIKTAESEQPIAAPSQRLDFELEMGVVIGRPNPQGEPIAMAQAEDHVFGITLFNDWSARDLQAWEYQPLGPFLSKNFASTISPWMVTLEALAPFRQPFTRADGEPQPLPYLQSASNTQSGAFDIDLEVLLQTEKMRTAGIAPEVISRSNFSKAAYWTIAQLVAHHTVGGCNLSAGDLFGTGTLSGSTSGSAGSLLELSEGGKRPITLKNGEQRTFLLDGDQITLRGLCEKQGFRRIGFGECTATVLAN